MNESQASGSRASMASFSDAGRSGDLSNASSSTARRTRPSSVLSDNPAEGATKVTSGPLKDLLQGYEQRQYPKSDGRFYFRRRLGDVEDGDEDVLYVNLWSFPDYLSQIITVHWYSTALLPSNTLSEEHDLVIRTKTWVDVDSARAEEKEGCTTVTIAWAQRFGAGGHKKSLPEIPGNYASTAAQPRTMAGKVRQMNNATADVWFDKLVQQVPKCKEDEVLMKVKDEIDVLLRDVLPALWEIEEWMHVEDGEGVAS
jgi:hypothetical protein